MTAKVTLSFSDQTIAYARQWAEREGLSLSAWVDLAARERALRQIFTAHATAVRRAGLDEETIALADEQEIAQIRAELNGNAAR
jgi:outer membrane lipopolysaccharide assembly protein LptE/RlpB